VLDDEVAAIAEAMQIPMPLDGDAGTKPDVEPYEDQGVTIGADSPGYDPF